MELHAFDKARLRGRFVTHQTMLIMKLVFFFTLACCLQATAHVNAQRITLSCKNVPLEKVFKEISRQSGYHFFYNSKALDHTGKINLTLKEASLEEVLGACFKDKSLTWVIQDKLVIVRPRDEENSPLPVLIDLTGKITDADGKPLEGVSVTVNGMTKGVSTNREGVFILHNIDENAVLRISYVGYGTQLVPVNKQAS